MFNKLNNFNSNYPSPILLKTRSKLDQKRADIRLHIHTCRVLISMYFIQVSNFTVFGSGVTRAILLSQASQSYSFETVYFFNLKSVRGI